MGKSGVVENYKLDGVNKKIMKWIREGLKLGVCESFT